jgi:hypothetical protein
MPLAVVTPDPVRPFRDHGVVLRWRAPDRGQAVGDCPFCGADGKFSVGLEDRGKLFKGGWGCFPCGRKGNVLDFVRAWHEHCAGVAKDDDYAALAADRRLMSGDTLRAWGVVRGALTGDWLVPAFDARGALTQLHYYRKGVLYGTSGLKLGLFGANLYDPSKPDLHVCEGSWDGMALWEVLGCAKPTAGGSLTLTGSGNGSLRATANVVAVPGANNWQDGWNPVAAGKVTSLLFDDDHPRTDAKTGKASDGAGLAGMRRTAELLAKAGERPASLAYLAWGDEPAPSGLGGTWSDSLASGFDVRDALTASRDRAGGPREEPRHAALPRRPDPRVVGARARGAAARAKGTPELECLPCDSWASLVNDWRKAMHWMEGLDLGLSVMLATALSTETIGEQLWFKVTGPPSCGKSILCEAMSVARKYVYPKDTFTGLTSGYQADKDGSQNMSLVAKIKNMTLIVNDADTIRTLANLPQVASQLRTFFSRNLRSQYGNKMSADHEGINCTIIFAGTEASTGPTRPTWASGSWTSWWWTTCRRRPSARSPSAASTRRWPTWTCCRTGRWTRRDSPEMVRAKRRTGGFVEYLRENVRSADGRGGRAGRRGRGADRRVRGVRQLHAESAVQDVPGEGPARAVRSAWPSSSRRLSKCLAAVLGHDGIGHPDVVRRVRRVALDTARGRTLNLVRALYVYRRHGATKDVLARYTHEGPEGENKLLHHLKKSQGDGAAAG